MTEYILDTDTCIYWLKVMKKSETRSGMQVYMASG
jgi:hypothetical protein